MNRNVYMIFSLMFCLSLYGCTKSPLESETEPDRANFSLQMSEGNPTLGNKAIFDDMRLYCFTQGTETEIHNPDGGPPISPNPNTDNGFNGSGGSWNSQFSHELYNITRTETTLSTNTAKAGLWDLVMVSSSGAELTPPLSSKKSSESLMYTYDPGPAASQSQAHEIWYRMLRLAPIDANTDQSASGTITRNMAMVKVIVDRAVDINMAADAEHTFRLHNIPNKISWSGTLLRSNGSGGYETSLTNPDTLSGPLTGKFTFTPHTESTEPNVYKSDELTFIIPAHRETDFWETSVTPIERATDTTEHLLHLSVSFTQASGGKFEKHAVIKHATRCNGILLVRLKMKDVGLDVNTSVLPWGEHEVSGDLKAPYLNVSALETTVYDGAASRIHFWSNAPEENIYIETKAGDNTDVNTIFDRIADKNAVNLVYDKTKKSGYIDIATLTPRWDKLSPVKIFLRAGDLRREITVNRKVSHLLAITQQPLDTEITTPYVGTFHRGNQTGERLVTWKYTGAWTAYIDNPGSGILIDRLPSPAFSNGILYTQQSNEPTDAEGSTISNTATSVSGMNRIYFRVGWKNQHSANAEPRYATITVRQGTNVSNGAVIQKIYCRQGEKAVAVYPNRIGPARYSPYNLTVGQENLITIPVRGGIFTDYPTQGGALFQWAHPENPRYAWFMWGTQQPAWNFNTPYYEPYWAEGDPRLEQQHETCPPGYRRVSDGGTDDEPSNSSELRKSLWSNFANANDAPNPSGTAPNTEKGFYADGFFDRRLPTTVQASGTNDRVAVSTSNRKTAYGGRLFYNATTGASIFFPFGGHRNAGGLHVFAGTKGAYWTASATTVPQNSTAGKAHVKTESRNLGLSIRCVAE